MYFPASHLSHTSSFTPSAERLTEYSPLLAFPAYYDESGELVQSPSFVSSTTASLSTYIRLAAFLLLTCTLFTALGLLLFLPTDPSSSTGSILAPIILVPDLFCSDLELRISSPSAESAALADCPMYASEWTSVWDEGLLYNHTRCLLAALTMQYDRKQNEWMDADGVEVRVASADGRGGRRRKRKVGGVIINHPQQLQQQREEDDNQGDDVEQQPPTGGRSQYQRDHRSNAIYNKLQSMQSLSAQPCDYSLLLSYLHSMGYRDHIDLHTLPYDWRRSSSSLFSSTSSAPHSLHHHLTSLVESLHRLSSHPILFITHGAGTDHILSFLHSHSPSFTSSHIDGLIALSGDMSGNMAYLPALLTGWYPQAADGLFGHVPVQQMRSVYQSFEYLVWKLPLESVYGADYVLARTGEGDEEVEWLSRPEDVSAMLDRAGADDMRLMYERVVSEVHRAAAIDEAKRSESLADQQSSTLLDNSTMAPNATAASPSSAASSSSSDSDSHFLLSLTDLLQLTNPFTPPPVNTMCLYPAGVPAISHYSYPDASFTAIPFVVYSDSGAGSAIEVSESQEVSNMWRDGKRLDGAKHKRRSGRQHQQDEEDEQVRIDNHSALGLICKHWSRILVAERERPNDSGTIETRRRHLLVGAIDANTTALPARMRTIQAIHYVLGRPDPSPDEDD